MSIRMSEYQWEVSNSPQRGPLLTLELIQVTLFAKSLCMGDCVKETEMGRLSWQGPSAITSV